MTHSAKTSRSEIIQVDFFQAVDESEQGACQSFTAPSAKYAHFGFGDVAQSIKTVMMENLVGSHCFGQQSDAHECNPCLITMIQWKNSE